MSLLSLLCAMAAFAVLGLATDEHHLRQFGTRASPLRKRRLRVIAWVALALSFPPAIFARGWVFGPVLWSGLVMLAAGAVFLFLNLAPPAHERTRP